MNKTEFSKELAFLLRHDKDALDKGFIDEKGWRIIGTLPPCFTHDLLEDIVKNDNKGRYEFNDDKTKIRARQGHSIPVDVELKETTPPDFLYHGTSDRFISSIMYYGIKKGGRLYVHLSKDIDTAKKVGTRHGGNLVVLKIDTREMYKNGEKFYLSNNGVWLTDYVNPKYIVETL